MAINYPGLQSVTNIEFWDLARKMSPSFASHTSKGTAELFTEKGFESLRRNELGTLNEYFELSLRVAFQMINVARVKNPLADKGLVQVFDTPNGGFTQRIAVDSIKPISPAYKGLTDGTSVDPFVVRKPKVSERFFQQNFDYQSLVTIQDFQVKPIFVSEYGMGEFLSGIMQGLSNGYTEQEYLNTKEAINAAINSNKYPLQDSQKIEVTVVDKDNMTVDELSTFILAIKDLVSSMVVVPSTSAYNAGKFKSSVDESDLVLLMRPSLKNRMNVDLLTGAINPENLSLPIEVVEVDNFGGLKPFYMKEGVKTYLYPVYDSRLGEQIGWAETEDATEALEDVEAEYEDPNEDILAIVAQRGVIFENKQNPYEVRPIQNPRGLYTNYWASSPNNAINYDHFYNLITVSAVNS